MDAEEPREGEGPYVQEINHLMLSDWQLELAGLERNRESVLGARQYPEKDESTS